jgi:OFA family oxalate/formate antiporter-like MFS transporter
MGDLEQKQHRVFYGWWIVGAVSLISAYVSGIVFYGFTAIFEPIANDFGWSYAQVSVAASIRGVETGILAPLVGFLIDRLGPRKPVFAGILITGLGLLLLSRINSLVTFYGAFILLSIGISACGGILTMTLVGNWFRRKVSTATGIAMSGHAIGGLFVPLITLLIDLFRWRTAMIILGLGAWVILLPLVPIIRHKPEQYGYLPDGDASKKIVTDNGLTSVQSTEVDIGVRQTLKSRAFWHISLGLACHVLAVMAVITHVMPYLSTVGVARSTSSLVASAISLVSIFGRLSFGWFGDRYDKRWVTSLGFAVTILGMLLFGYTANNAEPWLLVLFVIFFGVGFGAPIPMTSALVREYFGRVRLGTIIGLVMGVMMIGQIIGSPLAGWVFDNFGSYQGAWFAFAGVVVVGTVGLLTTPSAGKLKTLKAFSKRIL